MGPLTLSLVPTGERGFHEAGARWVAPHALPLGKGRGEGANLTPLKAKCHEYFPPFMGPARCNSSVC